MWFLERKQLDENIDSLNLQLSEIKTSIESLTRSPSYDTTTLSNRLAELEVKMAKIWSLIISQTPRGEDKLSRYGKKIFGGNNRELLK